ncbi:MAG: cyclic nucleotide-binding domain-containing protein [Burkholderiales bacterium]|nr:cyclic nucleotide-binding domain-containing protein [Burkholderiales bacterium]
MKKVIFAGRIRERLDWFSQVGYVTLNLFLKTEMMNHAAAVAYYFLLAIVPLLLILIFIFNSAFSGHPDLHARFIALIASLGVALNIDPLKSINLSSASGRLTGGVSILTLLWSASGLMQSVQSTFDVIFADHEERNFISGWVISLIVVPLSCLIVGFSMFWSYLDAHPDFIITGILAADWLINAAIHLAEWLVPIFLLWIAVFLAYSRLPVERPPLVPTLVSSVLCTLSILIAKGSLGHALKVDKYNMIYGSTGTIIFALLWVFIACIIFFLWAQFLYAAGKIDVIALEKIFLESREAGKVARKVEDFLFKRSSRIFEKYGRKFEAGAAIISQGEDSKSVYYLYRGKVGFYIGSGKDARWVRSLEEGEIFGEMAYLLDERRTASALAEEECFLFEFSPDTFDALVGESTRLSRRIIEALCQRLAK